MPHFSRRLQRARGNITQQRAFRLDRPETKCCFALPVNLRSKDSMRAQRHRVWPITSVNSRDATSVALLPTDFIRLCPGIACSLLFLLLHLLNYKTRFQRERFFISLPRPVAAQPHCSRRTRPLNSSLSSTQIRSRRFSLRWVPASKSPDLQVSKSLPPISGFSPRLRTRVWRGQAQPSRSGRSNFPYHIAGASCIYPTTAVRSQPIFKHRDR